MFFSFRRTVWPLWTEHQSTDGAGRSTVFGLFSTRAGSWYQLDVLPAGGVMCAAAYLIGGQVEAATYHFGVRALAAPVCLALNAAAWNADRVVRRRYSELPPDAAVNYLAIARATHSDASAS